MWGYHVYPIHKYLDGQDDANGVGLEFLAIFLSLKKIYCRLEIGNETYCKNYLSSILILSGENDPLCICVSQIRMRDAV